MSFNEIKEYSIPYKDKVDGQIIDPVEWNSNFIHIEEISDANREIINTTFDKILNDGANNILIDEEVIGSEQHLKEVLIYIINLFNNYYTSLITDEKLTTKLDKTTGNTLLQNVTFNENDGKITFVKLDGTTVVIDTLLEKLLINFSYNEETQQIVLTEVDGTVHYIDISALIDTDEIISSDQINVINNDGVITLVIKENSITKEMIDSEYREELTTLVESAQTSANNASTHATNAKTSETNALTYSNNAKTDANLAKNYSDSASDSLIETNASKNLAKQYAEESEYWAIGSKNGVAQGDNTDSKYYATQAGKSAQEAKNYRDEASEIVGGDYATKTELTAGLNAKENRSNITTSVLSASGWSGNVYSFESIYPSENYRLTVEPNNICTTEEIESWSMALMVGSPTTNILTALGEIPTIDIPIIVTVVALSEELVLETTTQTTGYYLETGGESYNLNNVVSNEEDLNGTNYNFTIL